MKLWARPCRATHDGWAMVESSDKTWSTGEGNGKPFQHSCLEKPMNSMKRQKDRTLKEELPRSAGAQHATGDQWRNTSRKNERYMCMFPEKIGIYRTMYWINVTSIEIEIYFDTTTFCFKCLTIFLKVKTGPQQQQEQLISSTLGKWLIFFKVPISSSVKWQ